MPVRHYPSHTLLTVHCLRTGCIVHSWCSPLGYGRLPAFSTMVRLADAHVVAVLRGAAVWVVDVTAPTSAPPRLMHVRNTLPAGTQVRALVCMPGTTVLGVAYAAHGALTLAPLGLANSTPSQRRLGWLAATRAPAS